MTQFFQSYFIMALEASVVILLVLLLRPIFKKFSNRVASLLWVAVLFRLLCPYAVEVPVPAFVGQFMTQNEQTSVEKVESVTGDALFNGAEDVSQGAQIAKVQSDALQGANAQNADKQGLPNGVGQSSQDASKSGDQISEFLQKAGNQGSEALENPSGSEGAPASNLGGQDELSMNASDGEEYLKIEEAQGADRLAAKTEDGAQGRAKHDAESPSAEVRMDLAGADAEKEIGKTGTQRGNVLAGWWSAVPAWFQSVQGKSFVNVLGVIWCFGTILLFLFGIMRYARLTKRLGESLPAGEWEKYPVKISDVSGVPMSFGVLRPGIYVPVNFEEKAEGNAEMILCHEGVHLKRRDPLWKMISLVALCLHWWNPLVWISIYLFNKDMEMACDEGVLSQIGQEKKKDYAKAILHFAAKKSGLSLAATFGESNAESRIREALKFKKRPLGMTILMACLVVLLAGCLATRPGANKEEAAGKEETTDDTTGGGANPEPTEGLPELTNDMITEITNLDQAIQADMHFRNVVETRTAPANIPYFGFDEGRYEVFYLDQLAENWRKEESEKYQALLDPVTALETLLPLKGGNGEAWQESFSSVIVAYTFANGETAHYYMAQKGAIWYPYLLVEKTIADPLLEEDSRKLLLTKTDQIKRQKEELAATTAEQLRGITLQIEDVIRAGNYGEPLSEDCPEIYICWNPEKFGKYGVIEELPKEDACLYGFYDGNAMMLRVGDQAYPIHGYWMNVHGELPKIYCGDYDQDGQKEFALITLGKTGTGVYGNQLRILEITEKGLEIYEPKRQGMFGQLEKMVRYQYDEKNLMLGVMTTDGDEAYASLEEITALASGEDQLLWYGYGESEVFSVTDDYLFYDVAGEVMLANREAPEYGGIDLECRLDYRPDGSFIVGDVELKEAWAEPVQEIDLTEIFAGESIISSEKADLNMDGVPDWVVTSVTYQEENRDVSWKDRLTQGEICFIRVYDGAKQEQSWKNKDVAQDAFDRNCVLWEKTLAKAHAGNGMVFLCEKDGKNYLLEENHSMFQGIKDAEYSVFAFDELGQMRKIETAKVTNISLATPEDTLDVLKMETYTSTLDEWIRDARLLVSADVDQGVQIGGKYDVTEIWKDLYAIVEELYAMINYEDSRLGSEIPKIIPLKDVTNLKESMNSLNACWMACAEYVKYCDNKDKILVDLQKGQNIYTCHLTHGRTPDTVTVDYESSMKDADRAVTIEMKAHNGKVLCEMSLYVDTPAMQTIYLTMFEDLVYVVQCTSYKETAENVSFESFKVFYMDANGNEQVVCERSADSSSKSFEKDKEEYEKALEPYLNRANHLVSVKDGNVMIKKKP
ncbi:MAG: M56 family metallopeptidase [Acetatifactor sp.]|nr:M56 family metallopeptidase [Acetatifactor sp.]